MHTKTQENGIHNSGGNPSGETREMMEPADKDMETLIRKSNEAPAEKGGNEIAIICRHGD